MDKSEHDQTAWLLERSGSTGPYWVTEYGNVMAPAFTKDPNTALRWSTKEDAQFFAEKWRVADVVPTEHLWPPPHRREHGDAS